MDSLFHELFQPSLTSDQLVEIIVRYAEQSADRAILPIPGGESLVTQYMMRVKPPAESIEGLWNAVRESRLRLMEHLGTEKSDFEPGLLRAVAVGEFILSHLGPHGAVALDLFCRHLEDEVPIDQGVSVELGILACEALSSIGPAAREALDALLSARDSEEIGETIAHIAGEDATLHAEAWAAFQNSQFNKPETLQSYLRLVLPRHVSPDQVAEACRKVEDKNDRNALVALMRNHYPDHPELTKLLKEYRRAPKQPEARTDESLLYHREGRPFESWIKEYLTQDTQQSASYLMSMALGRYHPFGFPEEDEKGFITRVKVMASRPDGREYVERIFDKLSDSDSSSSEWDTARLFLNTLLLKSLNGWVCLVRDKLVRYIDKPGLSDVGRANLFGMAARSQDPSLIWPILQFLKKNIDKGDDPTNSKALSAASRLLEGAFEEQEAVLDWAISERMTFFLGPLAGSHTLAQAIGERLFRHRNENWIDENMLVKVLGKSRCHHPEVSQFLKQRCQSKELYSKLLAQEALARCWADQEQCLQHCEQLLKDEEYGIAAYDGLVDSPIELLERFGDEAVLLAPAVLEYARREENLSLFLEFLEGLGGAVTRALPLVNEILEEFHLDDPLELEDWTQRVVKLRNLAEENS